VIVGRATTYKEKLDEAIQRYGLRSQVLFRHHIPFADFPAIYQGASVFLYPSRFEGFGIPIVEAMESGIPTITSTGSCFSEAGGPGTRYVAPDRADLLASELLTILRDEKLRDEMVRESATFLKRFQPAVIAAEMMNVYHSLSLR
jgi:glycosyltransferase involved in cell wall biosynthesis